MQGMRQWFLVACAAAAASGCSLLLSSEEFAGGDDPRPMAGDAGADGDAATVTDASAIPDGDAASVRFCASKTPAPTFCADFDAVNAPAEGWGFTSQNGPGTILALDQTAFVSAGTSLRAGIPAGVPSTGNGYTSRIGFDSPKLATKAIHAEAKVRVDAADATAQAYLLWLQFGGPALYLRASKGDASLRAQFNTDAGLQTTDAKLTKPVPFQTWTRIEIDVAYETTLTATVRVDGEVVLAAMPLDPTFNRMKPPQFSIGPGLFTSAQVDATEAHFDDALFDVR